MKDMQAHLNSLRAQIADCERLRREARSHVKRDIFGRLITDYKLLAAELERAIAASRELERAISVADRKRVRPPQWATSVF
jgi:hypothetical protein